MLQHFSCYKCSLFLQALKWNTRVVGLHLAIKDIVLLKIALPRQLITVQNVM